MSARISGERLDLQVRLDVGQRVQDPAPLREVRLPKVKPDYCRAEAGTFWVKYPCMNVMPCPIHRSGR